MTAQEYRAIVHAGVLETGHLELICQWCLTVLRACDCDGPRCYVVLTLCDTCLQDALNASDAAHRL